MCDCNRERLKMNVLNGLLSEFYYLRGEIATEKKEIERLRDSFSPSSIRYDCFSGGGSLQKTNDERLAELAEKTASIERHIEGQNRRAEQIRNKLHLDDLTASEMDVLTATHHYGTYADASEACGYSAVQICRIIKKIKEKLVVYV